MDGERWPVRADLSLLSLTAELERGDVATSRCASPFLLFTLPIAVDGSHAAVSAPGVGSRSPAE